MEKRGTLEIRVQGRSGNLELSPDRYDIRDIMEILKYAEQLLFPVDKNNRPLITYRISEGSVVHTLETSYQVILGIDAALHKIARDNYVIDFLETAAARSLEFFLQLAQKHEYVIELATSVSPGPILQINSSSKFTRSADIWVEAEFYFYGKIVYAGGKSKANIHLDTKEYGLLTISSNKAQLEALEGNPLYKSFGFRATGMQNLQTGEISKDSLNLLEIINYNPSFQPDYIQSLIEKASKSWGDVTDPDEWLQKLRGYGA